MPLSRSAPGAVSRQLLNSHEIRLLLHYLESEQGVPVRRLLAGTGVSPERLADPARRLTLEQELELYTRIAAVNVDPLLGIRVGRRLSLSSYGILGYAVMGAATVGEALALLTEFSPLISWGSRHTLSRESWRGTRCHCLTLSPTAADPRAAALEIESTLASLQGIFDELLGEPARFAAVHMQHDNPARGGAEFRAVFHCEVLSGRRRNAVLIPEHLVQLALPYPQPEYSALFRDMCRQSMAALLEERSLVEAIRGLILAEEGVVPTLEQVAARFSLSARTLRRHLRLIGVSYRGLVDETRYASARRYLSSTGLTVEAIAGQLGYADTRSFRTAFRRWSGTTPAAYRRDRA